MAGSLIRVLGRWYFPIAFVARLPFAMMVVGTLALVVDARGSLALAGLNSALVGLGAASAGPMVGAAADRWGQRPVLLAGALASSASLGALAGLVHTDLPDAVVLLVAFLVGASAPQVASMSRSRIGLVIAQRLPEDLRDRAFHGTMAYESAADEVIFIVGPVLVGVLATLVDPTAPVLLAAGLSAVAVSAFAVHPSAAVTGGRRPGSAPAGEAGVARPDILVVAAGTFAIGCFFGTTLTSLTAFMEAQGRADATGLLYGLMGVGSAALALGMAWLPARFTLAARWIAFAAILVAGTAVMPLAGPTGSVVVMGVLLLVLGLGVGPTMVTQYSLGALRSPLGRSATVMTLLGSAVIVGQATSSAITGLVADHAGADAALWLPLAAALGVLGTGALNRVLSTAPVRPATPEPAPVLAERLG